MTETFDFNNAPTQRSFDVIPNGTVATLNMTVRPGGAGEGGWLKGSKNGDSEGLDCEITVVDGEFAKRKFWTLFTLGGVEDGHAKAAEISRGKLRAILESAHGTRPDDDSDAAQQARRTTSYGDFNNMRFIGRIGVEPPQNGYRAKNTLDKVITPDLVGWHAVAQIDKPAPSAAPAAAATPAPTSSVAPPVAPAMAIKRPDWAAKGPA
jgi:hypothetical protein